MARLLTIAYPLVWLALFAASFIFAQMTEPTGDGFTRGFNRVSLALKWQLVSLAPALGAFFAQQRVKSRALKWLGRAPLLLMALFYGAIAALIAYLVLTKPGAP